jgi:hypothetical protein
MKRQTDDGWMDGWMDGRKEGQRQTDKERMFAIRGLLSECG